MKFLKSELALILALFITLTYTAFATNSYQQISNKVIRFHILANSDTDFDQQLKLDVKDQVFAYISDLTANCDTTEQAFEIISQNIEEINTLSSQIIAQKGYSYLATTTLDYEFYPQKSYDDFSLPSGYYTGIKIEIGQSEGHNWWCVLFPPLCNQTAYDTKNLNSDDLDLISSQDYEFRFKFVDIFSQIKHQIND
ncbi:MAG: stage II sporulation protein R [Clostridia bacterium]